MGHVNNDPYVSTNVHNWTGLRKSFVSLHFGIYKAFKIPLSVYFSFDRFLKEVTEIKLTLQSEWFRYRDSIYSTPSEQAHGRIGERPIYPGWTSDH
jgi:hypothetical protein